MKKFFRKCLRCLPDGYNVGIKVNKCVFGRECRYGIPFFIRNNVFLYNVKAWRCVKRVGVE